MNYFDETVKNERTNINFRINRLLLFLELNLKTKRRGKRECVRLADSQFDRQTYTHSPLSHLTALGSINWI